MGAGRAGLALERFLELGARPREVSGQEVDVGDLVLGLRCVLQVALHVFVLSDEVLAPRLHRARVLDHAGAKLRRVGSAGRRGVHFGKLRRLEARLGGAHLDELDAAARGRALVDLRALLPRLAEPLAERRGLERDPDLVAAHDGEVLGQAQRETVALVDARPH